MSNQDPRDPYLNVDPLKDTYRENIAEAAGRTHSLERHNTALLCIDMQYLDAAPGFGVFADANSSGLRCARIARFSSPLKSLDRNQCSISPPLARKPRSLSACCAAHCSPIIGRRPSTGRTDGGRRGNRAAKRPGRSFGT